jgi:hypothetical protein
VALHPLDQFRAFVALCDKGQGDEEMVVSRKWWKFEGGVISG